MDYIIPFIKGNIIYSYVYTVVVYERVTIIKGFIYQEY